jgi:2-dehydro-3-deoxyphosphogluconate aldolase / (4S)-4-hydroxy-2-oxoglutarate aldolase
VTLELGRVIPIVTIDDASVAGELADALLEGGIGCVEVTLRTAAGIAAIEVMAHSGLTVGVGTALTAKDTRRAFDAGARFVVSPGFDDEVVASALDLGMLPLPGIATPTELQRAVRAGLTAVKVFPVTQLGGAAYLSALNGPFPTVTFMPSGGISPGTAGQYLSLEYVTSIGASWVAPRAAIANRDFHGVRERAKVASAL